MKDSQEPFGDRHQQIVYIGQNLPKDPMTTELDRCLLTDEEMVSGPKPGTNCPTPSRNGSPKRKLHGPKPPSIGRTAGLTSASVGRCLFDWRNRPYRWWGQGRKSLVFGITATTRPAKGSRGFPRARRMWPRSAGVPHDHRQKGNWHDCRAGHRPSHFAPRQLRTIDEP